MNDPIDPGDLREIVQCLATALVKVDTLVSADIENYVAMSRDFEKIDGMSEDPRTRLAGRLSSLRDVKASLSDVDRKLAATVIRWLEHTELHGEGDAPSLGLKARVGALRIEVDRLRRCSTCGHHDYFACGECQAIQQYLPGKI